MRPLFAAASGTAGATLAAAGLHVTWLDCGATPNHEPAPALCTYPLRRDEVVLRVVTSPIAAGRRQDSTLGDAHVDGAARAGFIATVYSDRVVALARRAGVDTAGLMGRAMAHEIGHLLIGTHDHATRGLMRPSWSHRDLRRNRPVDWAFSGSEAWAMTRALQARAALP
jgi:hypothetical protein